MTITAKFNSICPYCDKPIKRGQKVDYEQGKAMHINCAYEKEKAEKRQQYVDHIKNMANQDKNQKALSKLQTKLQKLEKELQEPELTEAEIFFINEMIIKTKDMINIYNS